jgi:subtilisin
MKTTLFLAIGALLQPFRLCSRAAFLSATFLACSALLWNPADALSQGQQPARVDVLIGFTSPPTPEDAAIVRAVGGNVRYVYSIVPAIAASVPEPALLGLARDRRVRVIEPDGQFHIISDAFAAELDNTWGVKRIGSGTVHAIPNVGAGVKVAVIDSGVDYKHPELAGVYKGGYNFVRGNDNPMDDNGHGTHVAGTIAAARNGSGVVGVAPGVELYALKVLGASGSGSFSDVIAALQWCVVNGIQVSNNSYGSSGDPGTLVNEAFKNSYDAGVLHVAAAGNSGTAAGTEDNVGYPAKYDSVIAVAATTQSDTRASFSSTGPAVELAAPGAGILSTVLRNKYSTYSGTSMASPHVAGAAALVIASSTPTTPPAVRAKLQTTANDLGASGRDSHFGFGMVNVVKATEVTLGAPNTDDSNTGDPTPQPTLGTLSVVVDTDKGTYTQGESVIITVTVTGDNNSPVDSASVTLTITAPKSTLTGSGTTGSNGVVTFQHKVNSKRDGPGTYTASVAANKSGYEEGNGTTTYLVN